MKSLSPSLLDGVPPEELRRRLVALANLIDVTRDLAAELDLGKTLEMITHEACEGLDCERATVFRFDPDDETLYMIAANALEIGEIRRALGEGISGYVALHREVVSVADPASDPRWHAGVDQLTGFQTRNILALPLCSPHGNRLLGVLELFNKRDHAFDALDIELARAFGQHAAAALERAYLIEELEERHAVMASLNIARDIQRGFMPNKLPPFPGYEMATWWFPNEAIGGDYCDVIPFRDGRVGLVIADVSGHGLGPSLIMASVRAGLKALLLEHSSPEHLMGLLGLSLADDLLDGLFITMCLASLDPVTHRLEFANAGHAPAFHYSPTSGEFTTMFATGMPIGVMDRPEYPQGPPIQIEVGDLIVLCTDGIVEAMDANNQQFGHERLRKIIQTHADRPVTELVNKIGADVSGHYEGDSPPDDLTVLVTRRLS